MLFKQLECFLMVAKLGSMSRAAEEMYLTQPSLTARLKALEQEMGGQLFVRTKYGMRLTEAGREFMPYAERCVSTIESGKQHLKGLREGTTGHLKLGVLPRVGTYTLPTFLEELSQVYPRVLISVLTGHSKDVLNMVLTEEVQVGLARAMNHPEVESIPLYEEELVLTVSPKHGFAQRESVDLTELGREQLILFDRSSSNYDLTKSLFRDTGIQEPRTTELDNIETAKRMVEHQLGVSFLPRPAISRAVAAGRLRTVEVSGCPRLQRYIVALRRRDTQPVGAMAAFLEMISLVGETLEKAPLASS